MSLFIKFKTTHADEKHQFTEDYSPVYNVKEYVWAGHLRNGLNFWFEDENGNKVPCPTEYNEKGGPGITIDTDEANNLITVNNALTAKEGNATYNYISEDSTIQYNGKWKRVVIYVRVYDDVEGNPNKRWIAMNIQQ